MQTSNKHIFIVTYDYPPSNGGIARLCFELKKYLEKKGLNVTVICPQSTSTDAEEDNNVVRLHGRRGILELRTLKLYILMNVFFIAYKMLLKKMCLKLLTFKKCSDTILIL